MSNSNFCRTHFAGGFGQLPCPWPNCPHGNREDSFLSQRFSVTKEAKYKRESFVAADGEPRFFWLSENQSYGWVVRPTIRSELSRLAQPNGDVPIYHYTSLEGFHGIVESDDLWLTESAFMNDASEIEHGIELSQDVFESFVASGSPIASVLESLTSVAAAQRPRINVACFSSARDSLSQWRAYSKNTVGVALGFVPKDLLSGLGYPSECTLVPVLYSDAQKHALLDTFARFFSEAYSRDAQRKISVAQRDGSYKEFFPIEGYAASLTSIFFELVASCKHSAFADEREIRLVYSEHNEAIEAFGLQRAEKRFRNADGFLAPYTTIADIRQAHQNLHSHLKQSIENQRLPLMEIVVGPHPRAELAARSIRHYLDARGYGDVPVLQSAAPYR
jgi:hypothetical protein